MKKLAFTLAISPALLFLAACDRGNEDQVNNAQLNQPAAELNELANDAANLASEANALNSQAQNLQNEAANVDNTTNPQDADEQNVSGM